MIRLENIGKQNGKQIVFIEASAAIQRGEKVGLVGPNGAGKTTLFRMITGEEQPDEGQVSVDRGVSIGYFSQDVGDMAGKSAVVEVMDGVGPVSALAAEMADLELPWAIRTAPTRWTRSSPATARCRAASTSSTAMRSTAAPARSSAGWASARR